MNSDTHPFGDLSLAEEDQDVTEAWREEVGRRIEEIRAGKVTGVPAEQVFADLRVKYPVKNEDNTNDSGRE